MSAEAFLAGATTSQVSVEGSATRSSVRRGEGVLRDAEGRVSPDLVLTHHGSDLHQDHRLVAELTWNTFRDHLILEYEIPKYDGDLGSPNVFVHLEEDDGATKGRAPARLVSVPAEQALVHRRPVPRADAAARDGGGSPTGYAEGFTAEGRSGPFVIASSVRGTHPETQEEDMAELTQIETKIAEVIGLAQAAQGAPRRCRSSSRTAG